MAKQVQISGPGYGTLSIMSKLTKENYQDYVDIMKYAYEKGVRVFNGAKHYLYNGFTNIEFFKTFLEQIEKDDIVVTFKGNFNQLRMIPDGSKEACDSVVHDIVENFKDLKYKPKVVVIVARVDPNIPIEETVGYYIEHLKSGKIDGIGISECSSNTLERAIKVAPISCIEVEFSMMYQHIIRLGILKTASENGVSVLAYCPLSRGLLTDNTASNPNFLESLPDTDKRKKMGFDSFKPEHFNKNVTFLKKLYDFAQSKNTKLEALALSYILKLSGFKNFEGIKTVSNMVPIPSASTKERFDSNYDEVNLTDEELLELQKILNEFVPSGQRYWSEMEQFSNL